MKKNQVQQSVSETQKSINFSMKEIKKLLKERARGYPNTSLKIVRYRKNNIVHFIFKAKHLPETEYIVDEFSLKELFENIITSSWFIEKKEDGIQIYPESGEKKKRKK